MTTQTPKDGRPLIEIANGIAVLTFNRPDVLNAIDFATLDALSDYLDRIERDSSIGAVILTGSGDRAFSAGADIKEFARSIAAGPDVALREFVRRGQSFTRRVESFCKPIIAAVNGLAYGAGCEITEACPLALASEVARFAKPEIALGFPPPFGGTQRLPRHIGRKRALEMILTAQPISADEAFRTALVNRVVPHARLMEEAFALAHRILNHAPDAVAACLASVTRGLNLSIDEGLAVEAAQFALLAPTLTVQQGIRAFLDRHRMPGQTTAVPVNAE